MGSLHQHALVNAARNLISLRHKPVKWQVLLSSECGSRLGRIAPGVTVIIVFCCFEMDRMPVILDPQCYVLWLDPRATDRTVISEFLKPFDARLMSCFPVSSRVNRPDNDDPECSAPVEITQLQGSLFS